MAKLNSLVCAAFMAATVIHAQASSLDDCSPRSRAAMIDRVFDGNRLRSTILSSDILRLSICNPSGAALDDRNQRALEIEYRIEVVPVASLPGARLKRGALCPDAGDCQVEVHRRKSLRRLGDSQTFGTSGGLPFSAFLGHLGKAGHFEITSAALRAPAIAASASSIAVMAAASRDPDFFEWTVPAAHAQTPNDSEGRLDALHARGAQSAFLEWIRQASRRVGRLCDEGNARGAAYAMGYALHAIQDLAFHEGITNAEHSFLDYHETQKIGVDHSERYDEKFKLAIEATSGLLNRFRAVLTDGCWNSVVQLPNATPLNPEEKERLLGRAMDFSVGEFLAYRGLASRVAALSAVRPKAELFVNPRWLSPPREAAMESILRLVRVESR